MRELCSLKSDGGGGFSERASAGTPPLHWFVGGAGPRCRRVLGFIPSDVAAVLRLALESDSSSLLPWQGWSSALGKEDEDTESPSLSLLLGRSHLSLAGVWVLETVGVMDDDMLFEEADNWAEVGGMSGFR